MVHLRAAATIVVLALAAVTVKAEVRAGAEAKVKVEVAEALAVKTADVAKAPAASVDPARRHRLQPPHPEAKSRPMRRPQPRLRVNVLVVKGVPQRRSPEWATSRRSSAAQNEVKNAVQNATRIVAVKAVKNAARNAARNALPRVTAAAGRSGWLIGMAPARPSVKPSRRQSRVASVLPVRSAPSAPSASRVKSVRLETTSVPNAAHVPRDSGRSVRLLIAAPTIVQLQAAQQPNVAPPTALKGIAPARIVPNRIVPSKIADRAPPVIAMPALLGKASAKAAATAANNPISPAGASRTMCRHSFADRCVQPRRQPATEFRG